MIYAFAIAVAAAALRWLSISGAIAACIIGGVFWEVGGLEACVPLLVFFATGSLLSKLPPARAKAPARSAYQVLANGGVAAAALLLPNGHTACIAALCAAAADTWATEMGTRLGKNPFRITKLSPATAGVSGAVTWEGFLAAAAGAVIVALSSLALPEADVAVAAAIGLAGAVLDSILGDTLQARFSSGGKVVESSGDHVAGIRWLRNNEVNLVTTLAAGTVGYLLA